jgi:aminoglycoside phosphotransferase (APT) family kinase protein
MSSLIEQIQAAYERDTQFNREAVTAQDLPLSFDTITDRWLTAALCRSVPGAEVTGHRLSDTDNGSSNRRKIYLDYNDAGQQAGLPTALFCKATHDLANRIVLGVSGAAETETLFYNTMRPLLEIEAPVGRFALFHPDTCNSMVMLDDLSDSVQSFCNHHTVMTRQRAESQMRLLARVHGACFSNPVLHDRLSGFTSWREYFDNTLRFGMDVGAEAGFAAAEHVIPARLFRRAADVWPATLASVAALHALPHTLAHGDVHLKNWYVAGSGEMGLSDWQCASRTHWGRDLAYTITTALTVEDRRAWERDLLAYYLEHLASAGGAVTDIDTAWTIYRQQLVSALAWWTVTLCPPPGVPDMQPRDVTIEFIHRIATAIDDLDALDA